MCIDKNGDLLLYLFVGPFDESKNPLKMLKVVIIMLGSIPSTVD